jgi:hypothetical protein
MAQFLRAYSAVPPTNLRYVGAGRKLDFGVERNGQQHQHDAKLQRTAINSSSVNTMPPIVHETLCSPGQPLDASTRAFMEPRLGHDFSQVRVHSDAQAAESARAVNALAYTVGREVVFGAGQYAPATRNGQRLIAHELTHVLHQGAGVFRLPDELRVSETSDASEVQADAISINLMNGHGDAQLIQPTILQVARQTPSGTATASGVNTAALKGAAQSQHEFQQKRIAKLIDQGLKIIPTTVDATDPNTLFRNACQWMAAGKSTLVILTPTHDAATRQPGSIAYFDRKVNYPNIGGDYTEQPSTGDTDHIIYAPSTWRGGMQANEFTLIDPALQSDDELKETFIHEVQHAADQTFWGKAAKPPPGRVEGSPGLKGSDALISAGLYNNYQSEFRAYWIEAPEGSSQNKWGASKKPATNQKSVTFKNPTTQQTLSTSTNFKNERQEKIFWHIANNYDALQVPETYTQDPSYRQMVNDFAQPVGINLVNSIRIQALTDALAKCNDSMDGSAPEIVSMFAAVNALDDTDRTFLNDISSAKPFWAQAAGALSLRIYLQLLRRILRVSVGDFPPDPSWPVPKERALA